MAKNSSNTLRNWIYTILGIITLAGIFATAVLAWGDLDDLEIEGCKPAKKNTFDVALVQKDILTIQKSQTKMELEQREMRTEQRASFKEILKRLPK